MSVGNIVGPAMFDDAPPYKGSSMVLQPEEGDSYWQPVPASGYATIKFSPENCSSNFLSMGTQAIAEGGCVREHWHAKHEEILFCYEGQGEVLVDGTAHPFTPGTTVFVGRWVRHKIVNRGPGYLKMTWTYLPPGLEAFLRSIGAERTPGEPEPTPFKRPAHTLEIERTAGFGPKIDD
jgi:quercetin dioxygenase-like cupin family protein